MKIKREINLVQALKRKSVFLFGARWTGKTFAINEQLDESWLKINLLQSKYRLPLEENPSEIENLIETSKKIKIVIDEIQKVPSLLNEVHNFIEEKNYKFLLTGSSVRKLKRRGANLLGGQAQKLHNFESLFLISKDPVEKKDKNQIHCIHWKIFLDKLWKGQIVS